MAAVTICSDFGAQENSLSLFPLFPHLFAMKWWDWIFWMLSFKPAFSLSSFTVIKMFFSSLFSAISVISFAYLRLLMLWKCSTQYASKFGNLDSSLCFIQPIISHDVLCIKVKWARWHYTVLFSILNFEPVSCSMSGSNCCFLTCIQISQEAAKVVWYSHLLKNFLQFFVIHTVKGFSVVNEAEIDIFL